jgi:hypothetical protein
MKTDFSINVNVSIGVTPEVVALVTSILTKKPTATVETPASEQPAAEAPGDAAPAPAAPKRGRKAKTQAAEAPANETEPQAEAEEAAAPAGDSAEAPASEQPAAEAPAGGKALTVEDVREAMRRARVRIEGEDWETNTTGEGYTKYHRQLNATFKNIAALLGSDKPSTLSEDKFASFIQQCDELIVDADGTITTKCPF